MKILYVSPKPAFPIVDGGCFAMMQLIKGLAKNHTVSMVTMYTQKHPFTAESKDFTKQIDPKAAVVRMNTKLNAFGALWSLMRSSNYNLDRFTSSSFRSKLFAKIEQEKPDLIVLDGLFAAVEIKRIKEKTSAKVVVRTHNVESNIWKQHAEHESGIKAKYTRQLALSLKKKEVEILNAADEIWCISTADQAVFQRWFPSKQITHLPVAIDSPSDFEIDYTPNSCFHLGAMNWQPNIEAVDFLIDQLWSKCSDLPELILAGTHMDKYKKTLPEGVVNRGKVDHVSVFMSTSGVLVSPISSGSGIRIKILEALSFGVPVITTNLGAEGIDVSESGIVIANTPAEFKHAIDDLCSVMGKRKACGEMGKSYIKKMHSFALTNEIIEATFHR